MGTWVIYKRVSTAGQGESGLGLESQARMIADYLSRQQDVRIVADLTEVISGTGKRKRPVWEQALTLCKAHRATLIVARLDRASRDLYTLLGLEKAGIDFVDCSQPHLSKFVLSILGAVASEESRLGSIRTRNALAVAKSRGVQLGKHGKRLKQEAIEYAESLRDRLQPLLDRSASIAEVQRFLNANGIPTAEGKAWHYSQTWNLCRRLSGEPTQVGN